MVVSLSRGSGGCREGGLLGKFVCVTLQRGWQWVKRGHGGNRPRACLIVLEALICRGSAGNQVGLFTVFTGCSVLCLSNEDFFTNQEDAVMLKQFLASAVAEDERIRLISTPPPPSCPRSHKSASLVALTRGCLETFRCKLWRPWGLHAARGQPTIKRKQQVK